MVAATVSVGHGTLTLATTTGLTFTGGGSGQTTFSVSGSLINLNAALNGLTYGPPDLTATYTGTDAVQLSVSDSGHTALGHGSNRFGDHQSDRCRRTAGVLLNEIESNEPGTDDNRFQYIELLGTPGGGAEQCVFS